MNDPSIIASSISCLSCGYDLRGLCVDSCCPECSARIFLTVPHCPRCAPLIALTPAETGHRGVWVCPGCHGLGFETGELRRALSGERRPPTSFRVHPLDMTSQLPVKCGRCDNPGRQISVHSEVLIDRCEACGFVWLDDGELPAVAAFVSRITGANRLPPEMEQLLHTPDQLARRAERRDKVTRSITELIVYFIFGTFG